MEIIKLGQFSNTPKKKITDRHGMTMAEVLIVIAILGILAAVVFISVIQYQRNLAQLERDKIAKEIFIAAQNHLTVAKGEGYLDDKSKSSENKTDFGTEDKSTKDSKGNDFKGDYYFVANGDIPDDDSSVLGQMLPFGSIDETVRTGGSIIIRYNKIEGKVLDVFYCSRNTSPKSFDHKFVVSGSRDDYTKAMTVTGDDNKAARRKCSVFDVDKSCVLGWYGGADAQSLGNGTLKEPELEVVNGDKLVIKVKDGDNSGVTGAKLRVIIESTISEKTVDGQKSKVRHYLDVDDSSYSKDTEGVYNGYYSIVLDEVTAPQPSEAKDGSHICDRAFDDTITKAIASNGFIPGEDLKIKAVAYSNDVLSNIAYSKEVVENSLFASISDEGDMDTGENSKNKVPDTAYISSFRHLINLDKTISNLGNNSTTAQINITNAKQTKELDWNTFCGDGKVSIYKHGESDGTESGYFRPLVNDNVGELKYDGAYYSISNVKVEGFEHAGLFGSTRAISIKNVELIDFNITGSSTAGALAGTLTGSTISNVIARNTVIDSTSQKTYAKAIGATTAGGLIGSLNGGTVEYSAAALIVDGGTSGTAGGLIGSVSGSATVNGCYAGGHTKNGSYSEWIYENGDMTKTTLDHPYDVSGSDAGGLIGSMAAGMITNSYSTCSVNGSTSAGGFVGSNVKTETITGGNIRNCYCTGLVNKSETDDNMHAFIGSGAAAGDGNNYFSIINEATDAKTKTIVYMEPAAENNKDGISAIDEPDGNKNATTVYNDFTSGTDHKAVVYDNTGDNNLQKLYNGKYVLKSIDQFEGVSVPDGYYVKKHYGDWPAPEVFVINTSNNN